jgi:hypothetical protein
MQYTYNFVTEWLIDKSSIRYYQQGFNLLNFPSNTYFPKLNLGQSPDDSIYNENTQKSVSLDKLDNLIATLKAKEPIFLSKADRNSFRYGNLTIEDTSEILDIDSWFGPEIKYSMIFMFISGIIAIIGFVLLLVLCVRYTKLHHAFLYNIGKHTAEANDYCNFSVPNFYFHLAIAIGLIFIVICLLYMLHKLYLHLIRYNTLLNFNRISHSHSGNLTKIALEVSTLQNNIYIHMASLHTPIALLCMDPRTEIPQFVVSPSNISPTLIFIKPILLHHSDCETPITTPTNIPLGLYQSYKLSKLLQQNYFVRLVAFQQNTLIPLSNIMTFDSINTTLETTVVTPDISFKEITDTILSTDIGTPSTDYIEMTDMTSHHSLNIASSPALPDGPCCDLHRSDTVPDHTLTSTIYSDINKRLPLVSDDTPAVYNSQCRNTEVHDHPLSIISPRHIIFPFPHADINLYPKLT